MVCRKVESRWQLQFVGPAKKRNVIYKSITCSQFRRFYAFCGSTSSMFPRCIVYFSESLAYDEIKSIIKSKHAWASKKWFKAKGKFSSQKAQVSLNYLFWAPVTTAIIPWILCAFQTWQCPSHVSSLYFFVSKSYLIVGVMEEDERLRIQLEIPNYRKILMRQSNGKLRWLILNFVNGPVRVTVSICRS